jgi:hypothetical protein
LAARARDCHNVRAMATLLGTFRKSVSLTILVLLLGCGSAGPPPAEVAESGQESQTEVTADAGVDVVHRYTEMFFSGQTEQLREKFSEEMKQQFPAGRLELMLGRVQDSLGEPVEIVGEDSQSRGEYRAYVRWARFSKHEGIVEIQWILRPDDKVAGFFVRDARAGRDAPGGAPE